MGLSREERKAKKIKLGARNCFIQFRVISFSSEKRRDLLEMETRKFLDLLLVLVFFLFLVHPFFELL